MLHFGSSPTLFITTGGLMFATTCILVSLLQCQANRAHLEDPRLCKTLDVRHTKFPQSVDDDSIQIRLVQNGEESSCYKPNTFYTVTIRSSFKSIYGLLILQAEDKVFGTFPYVDRRRKDSRRVLQDGLTDRFCKNSVSHRCIYDENSESDYRQRCNLGTTLELPFLAPEDRTNVVQFHYTIVFTRKEYLENKLVEFPACPCEKDEEGCTKDPTPAPAPNPNPNRVCDISGLQITAKKAPGLCPKNPRSTSNELREITQNGVNYTCVVEGGEVRKKTCATGCMPDGKALCCRVEVNRVKMRRFVCIAKDLSAPMIKRDMEVIEQKRCECFYCEDACPAIPATENSVEVEHPTEMEGNSVEVMSSSEEGDDTEVQSSTTRSEESDDTNLHSSTTPGEVQSSTTPDIETVLNSV